MQRGNVRDQLGDGTVRNGSRAAEGVEVPGIGVDAARGFLEAVGWDAGADLFDAIGIVGQAAADEEQVAARPRRSRAALRK